MQKYQQAVRAYAQGTPIVEICRTYNVQRSALYKHIKRAGLALRTDNTRLDQLRDEIVALYDSGLSAASIAKHFGVSRSGVTSQLRKAGATLRDRQTTLEARAGIVDDYAHGMTYAQIAERNGVSESTIGSVVREAGLPSRFGYDPEQCRYVRELHEGGLGVRAIAEQLSTHPRRVSTMVRIAGGTVKPNRIHKEREDLIAETYRRLRNISHTAAEVGCAHTTVVRVIDEREMPRPKRGRPVTA